MDACVTTEPYTPIDLDALFGRQAAAVVVISIDGQVAYANPPAQALLRRFGSESPGRDLGKSMAVSGRQTWQDLLRRLATGGQSMAVLELAAPDGDTAFVEVSASVLANLGSALAQRCLLLLRDVTQKRRDELAHIGREELYRRAQEIALLGSFSHDLRTDIITASAQLHRLFGREGNRPARMADFVAAIHPGDRPYVQQEISKALQDGRSRFEMEYRVQVAGQPLRHLHAIGLISRDHAGRPVEVFGTAQDVTARREIEAAQSVANEQIRRLNRTYAVLGDISQLVVRERIPTAITAGACRIAVETGGFSLAWLGPTPIGNPAAGSVSSIAVASATGAAHGREILDNLWRQTDGRCPLAAETLATGRTVVCNHIGQSSAPTAFRDAALAAGFRSLACLPLSSGEHFFGTFNLYSSEPLFFDSEEVRLIEKIGQTIAFALDACRRSAEHADAIERMRRGEERFRHLLEHAADVILEVNSEGVLRFVSPSATTASGYQVDELLGRSVLDLVHPEDVAKTRNALRAAVAAPMARVNVEFRVRRADGTHRILQTVGRSVPELAPDGCIVLNARDITEARAVEDQLRHAQKMDAVGRLAGGVAHDFNNVLSAIRLQTELTEMAPGLTPEVKEGLRQIRGAAQRGANLTQQLLLFSRRQEMQLRELDINEVVSNLAAMLQRIIGETIRLQLQLRARPAWIRADAGMLDQVLMNLVVNARDAMPQGGVVLIETGIAEIDEAMARTIPEASPGRYVRLAVTDTGTGIPPDVLPRIFEPFYTTKPSGKGTGLGLATVFGIVKQHEGWLRVQTEKDRGTRFEVYLHPVDLQQATSRPAGGRSPLRGGTETILVVEDDSAVRFVTRAILERFGYQVLEAENGPEALTVWEQHRGEIALLLTDLVMPGGLAGHELAAQMQSMCRGLPVIYASGYSPDVEAGKITFAPGANFLQKPYAPEDLLETVRRSLDSRSGAVSQD